jgi:myo-inositol-1(or 4)-monophosphatase
MSQTLHPMLNIAIKAARAAGAIINRASLDIERLQVVSKSHNDFVTEVDKAAEDVIIATVLEAYPGHGILAEESGRTHGAKDSDFVWIIDPLDGTTNFIHGCPFTRCPSPWPSVARCSKRSCTTPAATTCSTHRVARAPT